MIELNDIKILQQQPENQQFDRKSFRIDPKAMAIIVVAFANADGGDRMFREMAEAGNPAPEYKQVEFMVKVKLTSALREDNVKKDTEGTDNVLGNDLEKEKWPETTQKSSRKTTQKSSMESSLEKKSGQKMTRK